jgi:hypothetical protein
MPFNFTIDALNSLDKSISIERLAAYLVLAKGDRQKALFFYERNRLLSQGLYGMIQGLEVALRNSIHRELTSGLGQANWYDLPGTLYQPETNAVGEAKRNIPTGTPVTPGRVIAQLTFGFWVKLVSRNYEQALWVPHLRKCFPHLRRPSRVIVFDRLDKIRTLRNSVAHHERILQRNLKADYGDILETLGWVCPVTSAWVNVHNSLQTHIF